MKPDEAEVVKREWLEELHEELLNAESKLWHGRHINAPWRANWIKEYTERRELFKARIELLEAMNTDGS